MWKMGSHFKMTSHILLFVNSKGKEVDRIYMNSPVNAAWEGAVVEQFKKNYFNIYKRMMKYDKIDSNNYYQLVLNILNPIARYADDENEIVFRMYTGEIYKKYGAVTIHYSKATGWDVEEDSEDLIDSKKNYSYVVWGYDDAGDFDKNTETYELIIDFIKTAIKLNKVRT